MSVSSPTRRASAAARPRVLLVSRGGGGRVTLACVRSLAQAGAAVCLASDVFRGAAVHSRFLAGRVPIPDPEQGHERFLEAVIAHLRETEYEVLFPGAEFTALPLVRAQERLRPHVAFAFPPVDAFLCAHDKLATLERARALGLAVPATEAPETRAELIARAERRTYPCVLKPRSGLGGLGVCFPGSPQELIAAFDAWPEAGGPALDYRPLVEDYVPGEVHAVCALFRHGEPRAALTQWTVAMHPAAGGPSVCCRTTDEPALRDRALCLLAALRWHGPAQVQFRVHERTGEPFLMEINPRLWGSVGLSIRAGVDFPRLVRRLAVDGDVEPVSSYRIGLTQRWLLPEGVEWALAEPRPLRALWRIARPARRRVSEIRLDDPLPHLAEAAGLARLRWRARAGARRRGRAGAGAP